MTKTLLLLILLTLSQLSFAEEISAEKKLVIDEFLQVSGELDIEQTARAMTESFIGVLAENQSLDPRMAPIAAEEIGAIMREEFVDSGFINRLGYQTYGKYFSLSELKDLVAFYKTPTGRKMAARLPRITAEKFTAGDQHALSLGPIIEKRLMARFREVGIIF
jgi:hypothetical protein